MVSIEEGYGQKHFLFVTIGAANLGYQLTAATLHSDTQILHRVSAQLESDENQSCFSAIKCARPRLIYLGLVVCIYSRSFYSVDRCIAPGHNGATSTHSLSAVTVLLSYRLRYRPPSNVHQALSQCGTR